MRKQGEEIRCIAEHDCGRLSTCIQNASALICKLSKIERPWLSALFFTSSVITKHAFENRLFVRLLLQSLVEVESPNRCLRKTLDKLTMFLLAEVKGSSGG